MAVRAKRQRDESSEALFDFAATKSQMETDFGSTGSGSVAVRSEVDLAAGTTKTSTRSPALRGLDEQESTATLLPDSPHGNSQQRNVSGGHSAAAHQGFAAVAQQQTTNSAPGSNYTAAHAWSAHGTVSPTYTTGSAASLWQAVDPALLDADMDFAAGPAPGTTNIMAPSTADKKSFAPGPATQSAPPRVVARKEVKLEPHQSKLRSVLENDSGRMAPLFARVPAVPPAPAAEPNLRIDTRVSGQPSKGPYSAPPVQQQHQYLHKELPPLPAHSDSGRRTASNTAPPHASRRHHDPRLVSRSGSEGVSSGKPNNKFVGPYELTDRLGAGSVGEVKLGVHKETGHRVAIKIVPKDDGKQVGGDGKQTTGAGAGKPRKSSRDKLEREVAIMKLIRHPNVLELYDVYETEHHLYLVLELVEGGELFDYLVSRGRLPEVEALRFFQQIIGGLAYCHSHLVCHRDLKPENLLLNPEHNQVKIADFGMANLQIQGRLLQTSCGSPHYASPEVIRGVEYDGALADIWSCGVILYALLTGGLPFDDPDIKKLLAKVKTGVYVIPGRDVCSAQCQDLLARMLTVDPAHRIQMKDILRHPFFLSRTPSPLSVFPSSINNHAWTEPIGPDVVDKELIRQLVILGWGTPAQIEERLASDQACQDKAFYVLLQQRQRSAKLFRESSRTTLPRVGGSSRASSFAALPMPEQRPAAEPQPIPQEHQAVVAAPGPSANKLAQRQQALRIAIPPPEERTGYSQPRDPWEGTTPRFHRPIKKSASILASETSNASLASPKRSWFANLFFGTSNTSNNSKQSAYASDFRFTTSPSASSTSDAESSVSDYSTASESFFDLRAEVLAPSNLEKTRILPGAGMTPEKISSDIEQVLRERGATFEHVTQIGSWLCTVAEPLSTRSSYDGNGDARMQDASSVGPSVPAFVVQLIRGSVAPQSGALPSYIGSAAGEEETERLVVEVSPRNEQAKSIADAVCKDLRLCWNLRRPVANTDDESRRQTRASSKLGRELRRLVNAGREMMGQ